MVPHIPPEATLLFLNTLNRISIILHKWNAVIVIFIKAFFLVSPFEREKKALLLLTDIWNIKKPFSLKNKFPLRGKKTHTKKDEADVKHTHTVSTQSEKKTKNEIFKINHVNCDEMLKFIFNMPCHGYFCTAFAWINPRASQQMALILDRILVYIV